MGIGPGRMIPEERAEIMARVRKCGRNRIVAGMHYPSDVGTDRIAGSATAVEVAGRADPAGEHEAARGELRPALGPDA